MAFRFKKKDATVEDGIRRIACEQIDKALVELDDPQLEQAKLVHQVRKRMKKLRGLIRLVRPGLPSYAYENAYIREAARNLSALRDSDVMLKTFDRITDHGGLNEKRFQLLRAVLTGPGNSARPDAEEVLQSFRAELLDLRARVADWKIEGRGDEAMLEGMKKVYKRARKAMKTAREDGSDEAFHDWRKRAKYHWYHSRIVAPIASVKLADLADMGDELSDALGDHHDVAVCLQRLSDSPQAAKHEDLLTEFCEAGRSLQDEFAYAAFSIGKKLFDDKPGKTRKRWEKWWRDWRAT